VRRMTGKSAWLGRQLPANYFYRDWQFDHLFRQTFSTQTNWDYRLKPRERCRCRLKRPFTANRAQYSAHFHTLVRREIQTANQCPNPGTCSKFTHKLSPAGIRQAGVRVSLQDCFQPFDGPGLHNRFVCPSAGSAHCLWDDVYTAYGPPTLSEANRPEPGATPEIQCVPIGRFSTPLFSLQKRISLFTDRQWLRSNAPDHEH
jgi:hypothetical protein